MSERKLELAVGGFVLTGLIALFLLAFSVAGISLKNSGQSYTLYAKFDNIGGLKVRSPVKLGGVLVGRVEEIKLDIEDYSPVVKLKMDASMGYYPDTSSLAILTAGLLGEQYLALKPGFVDEDVAMLNDGEQVEDTKSALVLEDLIGQFLFSVGDSGSK